MEQIAGRRREKMKDLRTPPAKRRHAELSPVPGASHPSCPGSGSRKAGGKLGHGDGGGANLAPNRPGASCTAAGCSATVRPSKVVEVPPGAAGGKEQGGITTSQLWFHQLSSF